MKYTSGSEWRNWDLHLHTPSSYDYQNKSVSNQDIVRMLQEKNVAAVVVTDHHIIDFNRINELNSLSEGKIHFF